MHVLLGDILPGKLKIKGMHHASQATSILYEIVTKAKTSQRIQDATIFKKNLGKRIGAYKNSTLFPENWDYKKCVQKIIQALENKPFLSSIKIRGDLILLKSRTRCGKNIEYCYCPFSQTIKSFYPKQVH